MGAGIAKAIADKFPVAKIRYSCFCEEAADPYELLGQIHVVRQYPYPFDIVNVFGQLNYGRSKGVTYTDYDALERAFRKINGMYGAAHQTVAFPWGFGCGLAGGDWTVVMNLMLECLPDCNVKIYMKR